jgi:hypothetical protein
MTRGPTKNAVPKANPERRWFNEEWPDCQRCHRTTVMHSRQGYCSHCARIELDGAVPTAMDALILKGLTFDRGPRLKRRLDITPALVQEPKNKRVAPPVTVSRLAEEIALHYDTRMADRIANMVLRKMEIRMGEMVRVNVRTAIGEMLA